jgi:fructan beta-fructosidase
MLSRAAETLLSVSIGLWLHSASANGTNDAGLLAYEGFNYAAATTLAGKNGGTGWSNSWVDVSGNSGETLRTGSLSASTVTGLGFDNRSLGNSAFVANASRAGRWLDCSPTGNFAQAGFLNASGAIGAPGKTLYLSFLQQPSGTVQFYEFEFHRNNLGDPGRIAGVGNDLADTPTINLRAPNGKHTPFGIGNTNVNFYILRIDYHGGSDDVFVYRNPTGATESDNEPALTMLAVADMSFNGISLAAFLNSVTVSHDEIRIGPSWNSVLGSPPAITMQPTNQAAYVGQDVDFTGQAISSQPVMLQWYCGSNAIAGATNASLVFSNVQLSDANTYWLAASNALGFAASQKASLIVQAIAVTLTTAPTLALGQGSNLMLGGTVCGAAPVAMQWYRNGQKIAGATNASYSITDGGFYAAGQYTLVASNAYGCVTSAVMNAFADLGGLLAYEGFNYTLFASDIAGANGGFGWDGAWINLGGNASSTGSNSLPAGSNAPAGFDSRSRDGSLSVASNSRKGRFLDCTPTGNFALHGYLDASGNIGADGKTLYLSFLQQLSDVLQFYEFEFKRGALDDSGRIAGIGNDTSDSSVHFRTESSPGGASTFLNLGPGSTNVAFYVVRIDFKAGNDDLFVYRNPTTTGEPASATLTASNLADLSFDGVSVAAYLNEVTVSHDELRFGMSWNDVVGTTVSQLRLSQRTNTTSSLLVAGSPNCDFAVQAAETPAGPWTNLGSIAVPNLGLGEFLETNATGARRFYRALNGLALSSLDPSDVVIADFEGQTYGSWSATGTAFGSGPAQGTLPNQNTVSGYQGSGLVNSFNGGDASTGTLTSPPFVITKPYLNFLIGGGNLPGQECLNLVISNVVVATATGANSETLAPRQWDVSAYLGQTATLGIVDSATGGWGHINVDQIVLSDAAFPSLTRTLPLTNTLLSLPVKNGSATKRITVSVGGNPVRDFDIGLADATPDWWAFVDLSPFSNQTATVSVSSLAAGSTGLSALFLTNGIVGASNLYREALRPQLHFCARRGWLNDPNGLTWNQGEYHLYYQHNPYGWSWGDMHWGHAVSSNLVQWTELPIGIYPHQYGDWAFSGSAVVDGNNTAGFKTGAEPPMVSAYTSTGRGQCIAFSNDRGRTFTDYSGNPVVINDGRDPRLLWYAPSNYWVMAVYDATGGDGIAFYSSPNLRQWTYRSRINGFFECPDLYALPLDGQSNAMKWVLSDASSGYMLGQFNGAVFTPETAKLTGNSGAAFYAAQTFSGMPAGDARLVRIGWGQIAMPGMLFNQMMYFPTELTLRTLSTGVQLCARPVAEITNLVANQYFWTNLAVSPGVNPLSGIRGTLFDIKALFTPGTVQTISFVFQDLTVTYSCSAQTLSCNGVTATLAPSGGVVQLEILVDRDSIELFGNNGQLYMPLPASNPVSSGQVSLSCTGGTATFNSLTVSKLKSAWPAPQQ